MKNIVTILFLMFLLLFTVFSCKKEESFERAYLEFVSPSDEILLIGSEGSYPNVIEITLKTNRSVFITSVDSVSNNTAHWIMPIWYRTDDDTIHLLFTVYRTQIRRAARIIVTTLPTLKDVEPATISILVRQSEK